MKIKLIAVAALLHLSLLGYQKANYQLQAKVEYVLICNSRSAYAYHAYQCRGLTRCAHGISKVTRAQAIHMGYKACKICY